MNHITLERMFDDWRDDVLNGEPPRQYETGNGLEHVRLGPGTVALLGGAPGGGKTAFAMQLLLTALAADESLTACVANVEMPPERLLERQLSRLSGIPLDDIQDRRLNDDQRAQVESAFDQVEDIGDRLVFCKGPFTLESVAVAADTIDAELVILDYIQRIRPAGKFEDKRGSVDATMDAIRRFADTGCCVLALSAVGRSKDIKGRTSYDGDGLSLASFRESSELEYGADDAFMLVPSRDAENDAVVDVTLRHLKSRYGKPTDCRMTFDRSIQRFDVEDAEGDHRGHLMTSLAQLWEA